MGDSTARPGGITFEVFVKNAILKVQKEASGRGKEVTEIRQECQKYLGMLITEEFYKVVEWAADVRPMSMYVNARAL